MAVPVGSLLGAISMVTAEGISPGEAWAHQPSIRKVTDFIAGNVASIPLHAYEFSTKGRARVRDGNLARILSRPSRAREETQYTFWKRFILDSLLWDGAIAFIDEPNVALMRIPPQRWLAEVDGFGTIQTINIIRDDGVISTFSPDSFLILPGYSFPNSMGVSPVETLAELLKETNEALEFRRTMWQRQATHTGVVERANEWESVEARDNFLQGLRAFDAHSERHGGTMLLDEGMVWKDRRPSFKPSDLEDIEARKLTDIEVASMYHIAPEMLGIRQGNYSNMEAFRQSLYRDNLGPYIEAWQQAVAPLVEVFGTPEMYIEAFMDAKLRGNFEEQAKTYNTLVGAPIMTRNEGRAKMNLPNIEGGDALITPLNVLEGGQASPHDVDSTKAAPRTKGDAAKSVKSFEHIVEWSQRAQQLIAGFLERQARAVKAAYDAGGEYWDQERWDRELAHDLAQLAVPASESFASTQTHKLGVAADDYNAEMTVAYLEALAAGRASIINAKTHDMLLAALAEGKTVEEFYKETNLNRALTIGAAFMAAVASWTAQEVGRQVMDGEGYKTWIVTSAHPRPSHAAQDGVTVGINDVFPNGQAWPGDPSAGVDEVAGCMCGVEITWIV
nr:MAG TPA: portal protein [Caudoviricetes sp.]